MAKTILDLPPELVANIFHHTDNATLLAGRLASRHLEQASFTLFGRRFFRKKGYMITTPSLDVLQCVASHERLRLCVQHLWFNPDCYTFGPPLYALGFFDKTDEENAGLRQHDRYADDPVTNRRRHEAHFDCAQDHTGLIKSERALADRLEKAFASMPNLKTVGMRRSTDYNPWGWSRLRDAVGRDPRELGEIPSIASSSEYEPSGPTLLYIALLHSLAASGTKVRRFYTDAIELDQIKAEALPLDVINKACNSVLYLEANATKTGARIVDQDSPWPDDRERSLVYGSGIANLLSACPDLRELGLMILSRVELVRFPHLAFSHVAAEVKLQNLRRIKLEHLSTKPSVLLSFLKSSSHNLTSLKLRNIMLMEDHLTPSPTQPGPQRVWAPVFAYLASCCSQLSYFLLHKATTVTGSVQFVQHLPASSLRESHDGSTDYFAEFEHITVEVGVAHNDPDVEGKEKRAAVLRAREAVNRRIRTLVEAHWYGNKCYSYDMDELIWHTDTSDEEW